MKKMFIVLLVYALLIGSLVAPMEAQAGRPGAGSQFLNCFGDEVALTGSYRVLKVTVIGASKQVNIYDRVTAPAATTKAIHEAKSSSSQAQGVADFGRGYVTTTGLYLDVDGEDLNGATLTVVEYVNI